ncbi:MAG: ECF-type sigma factor [Acidobacteriota bacterium]
MFAPPETLKALLAQSQDGKGEADVKLFTLLYDDLRQLARQMLRQERDGHSVQATALVHEAFLRLAARGGAWTTNDRKHFLALAGRVMRRLLIDRIRRKQALKRPQAQSMEEEIDFEIATPANQEAILEIDHALEKLEALSPRTARIVEWHYLIGFTIEEIAATLEVSPRTIHRDLNMAKCFLSEALQGIQVK